MRTALGRRAHAVVVGCMLVGWTQSAWADCTKDTDCKGDRICTAGACTDPPPPPALEALPAPAPPPPEATVQPAAAPPRARATSVDPEEDDVAPVDLNATKPRSPSMATAGIVLTVAGAITLVATTALAVKGISDESSALSSENSICSNGVCSVNDEPVQQQRSADQLLVAAYLSGIATAALLGAGIPLYFVGHHQVPVHQTTTAWWVPERVSANLGRVTLTYGF
jgi:hypothetical protein